MAKAKFQTPPTPHTGLADDDEVTFEEASEAVCRSAASLSTDERMQLHRARRSSRHHREFRDAESC